MKSISFIFSAIFCFMIFSNTAYSQLLNNPESVVYDSIYSRYLVSNMNTGNIVQIDSNGIQSNFAINQQCYAGLHIIENNIYAACGNGEVKGFNLHTGALIMNLLIPGAQFLNDITSDNSGNLYITDPQANRINRVNLSDLSFSIFVASSINSPNGILFDEHNNRLLLCSSRYNSPIQGINLVDSTVSIIALTGLDILDGLTVDNERNYYVSSWGSSSVYRFDSTFSGLPEFFSSHSNYPADIFFNKQNNILAVPVFYFNRIDFIPVSVTSVDDRISDRYENGILPGILNLRQNYPNPFNSTTTIEYFLYDELKITVTIYDILGKKVSTLVNQVQPAGLHQVIWDIKDASSGIYFYELQANRIFIRKKMLLLK